MDPIRTFVTPATTRSRLVLEVASELVGWEDSEWPFRQARLSLRRQGAASWDVTFFGSDTPAAIDEVARGEVLVAMTNPSEPLTLALRGTGPFPASIPVRAITVIPSFDQLALAVAECTGLTSLADIRERQYPLRVSVRGQVDHSTHFFVREVLAAAGLSLDDIVAWGGEIHHHGFPPDVAAVAAGEVDAIFDEGVRRWTNQAVDAGMRFLSLEDPLLQRLEQLGFRRGTMLKSRFPKLPEDVLTLDFSGWPVFTLASAPDAMITAFCAALEARKDRIPWQGDGPLPLELMCRDTPDGPLDIPLHPAAERYWRERGHLG